MIQGEGEVFDLIRLSGTDEEVHRAWLGLRRDGVGGSDVAAIMGLSPWSSPYQVWADKVAGVSEDISGKPAVMWGNILEPVVGEHYRELHPDRIVRRVNGVARSIKRPWAQASLDYEVKDPELGWGVLEIKTAGQRSEDKWEEGVPLFYMTQVTHYLSVTGRPFADVAVLIGGQDYREYRIMRDESDIETVDGAVDAFWRGRVIAGEAPDPGELDGRAVLAVHPEQESELTDAMEMPEELRRYLAACEEAALADKAKKLWGARLKELIGGAKGIQVPEGRAVWVRGPRRSYDYKALDRDHPGLRDGYAEQRTSDGGIRWTPSDK